MSSGKLSWSRLLREGIDETPDWYREESLEVAFRKWLEKRKWGVFPRRKAQGDDIRAFDQKGALWRFEVKGLPQLRTSEGVAKPQGSIKPKLHMGWLYALAEIVWRMKRKPGDHSRSALVFPDTGNTKELAGYHYFRTLSLRMDQGIRSLLHLWIFLIDASGSVKVLPPTGTRFVKWSSRFLPRKQDPAIKKYRRRLKFERVRLGIDSSLD
jgi:hypothetical protein